MLDRESDHYLLLHAHARDHGGDDDRGHESLLHLIIQDEEECERIHLPIVRQQQMKSDSKLEYRVGTALTKTEDSEDR